MGLFSAMVKKDLKLLFRDKVTVFFTFAFPLIFAAFFGSIFSGSGGGSGISVAVTDLDQTSESAAFVQRMDETDSLRVTIMPEFEAREATRKGKKVAYIILPKGFGAAYASLFSGGTPKVIIGVDPSRKAEAAMLEGIMMKLGVERFQNALSNTDSMLDMLDDSINSVANDEKMPDEWQSLLSDYLPKIKALVANESRSAAADGSSAESTAGNTGLTQAMTPLDLDFEDVMIKRDGPKNGYAITIPQAMYWAILGVVMGFSVALVQEKTFGTMTRLIAAPISRMQILGGKALSCFLALLLVMLALFIFAMFVFDVPIEHPLKVLLALVSVSTGFVGIMMFIAAVGKTERGISSMGWGVMLVFAMFGGAMIPLFAMPEWMKSLSDLSPVKWAILSFEGATWRNFSYAELALPFGIMLALGIICFLAGARMIKLEE